MMTNVFDIVIVPQTERHQEIAQQWAQQLKISIVKDINLVTASWLLLVGDDGLSLKKRLSQERALRVDFIEGAARHRRLYGGGKSQALAKAIGVQAGIKPFVLDATAGLGRDAFVLASLGCRVQLLERSHIVSALLQDGLARAVQQTPIATIVGRMYLSRASSVDWLKQCSESPDVVYLDPMFPMANKSALVKKDMRLFHELIGQDEDADQLLPLALDVATHRVVVKRPRLAHALNDMKPTYALLGKSNRFDIYALKSFAKDRV